MGRLVSVPATPEFLLMLDTHRARRPDRPTRAAILREFAIRGIEAWERERRAMERDDRQSRARAARAEAQAARSRSEAARLERERERAARKAERASVPTWNAPIEPEPERAGPDASS